MKYTSICVAMSLMIAACQGPRTMSPKGGDEQVSQEQKRQKAFVEKGMKEERERIEILGDYIQEAGQDLCEYWDRPLDECDFTFKLDEENTGQLNAFADGENIIVTYRMARFARSDDELAYVLAHEFAHNLMEHSGVKRKNSYVGMGLGAIADVLVAAAGINTGGAFTKMGAGAGAQAHSVEFEREADYIGLYIAYNAGFDIDDAPKFWRQMAVEHPKSIYLSSTHPTTADRFVTMEEVVEEIMAKEEAGEDLVPELKENQS